MDRHRFPWRMAAQLVAVLVSLLAIVAELAADHDTDLLMILLWTVVGGCALGLALLEAGRLRQETAPAQPVRPGTSAGAASNPGARYHLLPPEEWAAARELADRLAAQGRTSEAIDILRRLADLNDLAAFLPLALLLDSAGATADAVRYYRVAAAADDDGEAAFRYGTALARLNRVDEAIEQLRTAVDRGHQQAANNLGSMLHRSGETEAARQLYLLGVVQGDPVAATNLARDLLDEGNTVEAKRYLQVAVDGGDPDGSLMLGQLLEDEGDHLAAVACYREAAAAHPAALIVAAGALWKAGLTVEADEMLAVAAGHEDRQVAFEALSILVLTRTDEGNDDAATIWLRRAAAVASGQQLVKLRQDRARIVAGRAAKPSA